MLREFRDFILKGNVLDLAIAVILAVAFGAVVTAFTEGMLMPLIAAIVGKPDFNALVFHVNGTPIHYGTVLTAIVNLLLIGGALFLIVKGIERARRPKKAAEPAPETDHDLLAQIRDELRRRSIYEGRFAEATD
jgi:large conductance mechanosensitive channel